MISIDIVDKSTKGYVSFSVDIREFCTW